MKRTINFCDFCDAFVAHDRSRQFTYQGKKALFDYIESYEEREEELELDVIALCCEYTEYESFKDFVSDYGDFEGHIKTTDDIADYTTLIKIDENKFMILNF